MGKTFIIPPRLILKILRELLDLFCLKFTPACKKRRKFCLYFAATLLCEHVNTNVPLFTNKHVIENVNKHTHLLYKQVKKNERAPNTDYLFQNTTVKSNLEKTIDKLKSADGLVVGSAICKEISRSLKHRQNPVTNVSKLVKKLKSKIL